MAYPTPEEIDAAIPVDGEPSRALTNAAIKDVITESETKASATDLRFTDSRTPSGAAGGVLAGSYPSPTFAEPMATESQLDTKIDKTQIGVNGGVAPLDEAGVVPTQHLNVSGLNYFGAWDASTNTPELLDGTGSVGDFGKVSVAGTQDFGNGLYNFTVGDWVIFAAGTWQRIGVHEAVASVNGRLGAVVLTAADVNALPATYQPDWNATEGPAAIQNKPEIPSSGSGVPIGTVLTWLASVLPTGFIWLDEYTAGTYPELDALFPSGVPDIANRVFRHVGDLTGAVGSTQEDAMQQITGYIDNVWTGGPARQGGSFTRNTADTSARPSAGTQGNARFDFDSANSPGARTAEETRVKSVIFRAIIKAYN